MAPNGDIAVVFEDGVLKPETDLGIPDHTRLIIAIRRVEVTAESAARALETFRRIRAEGLVRLDGWHPTRDEMHERD